MFGYWKRQHAIVKESLRIALDEKQQSDKAAAKAQAANTELLKKIVTLREEIETLRERQANCNEHRLFIDDATNWLGPFADRSLKHLKRLIEDLEALHDAYYTVEGQYPWQE